MTISFVKPSQSASTTPAPNPVDSRANNYSSPPSPPFVNVEGVSNFRDLGGYACRPTYVSHSHIHLNDAPNPQSVRRGTLFRCAQLSQITPTGASTLTKDLKVRDMYDLRSQPEITSMMNSAPHLPRDVPGIKRHFVPVYREEDYSPVVLASKYAWYTAPDEHPSHGYSRGFVKAYEDIARHASSIEEGNGSYRAIMLHLLERSDDPFIFHCTAGKDRTGVLGALILKLCGVDNNTIAWEYALTTQGLESWRDAIIKRMTSEIWSKGSVGSRMTPEQAERVLGSRARNMQVFVEEVVPGVFGGARGYFREWCGFTDEELDCIVRSLVVGEEGMTAPEGWRAEDAEKHGVAIPVAQGKEVSGQENRAVAG